MRAWLLSCAVLASCSERCATPPDLEDAVPPDERAESWHVVFEDLEGPVLSAWTSPSGRTFFVGGTKEAGLILSTRDGLRWERMECADAPRLWWITGFSDDAIWAVGENGTTLFYDGVAWRRFRRATLATLYGVFGARPDEVFAVGQGGTVVRFGGVAWDLVTTGYVTDRPFFKVARDVNEGLVVVGEAGAILRRSSEGRWFEVESGTKEPLFTIADCGALGRWAVGGRSTSVILRTGVGESSSNSDAFFPVSPPPGDEPLIGITCAGREVYLAGAYGTMYRATVDPMTDPVTDPTTAAVTWSVLDPIVDRALHFVHVGGGGVRFAGGGRILDPTHDVDSGILLAHGDVFAAPITGAEPRRPERDSTGSGGEGTAAGGDCASAPRGCASSLACYTPQHASSICTHACVAAEDCVEFGAAPCCLLPQGQALTKVCIPSGRDPACP